MKITAIKTKNSISLQGLNQKHVNALKQLLSTCSLGADMLRAMNLEEAGLYFQNFTEGKPLTEADIQQLLKTELEGTNALTEILEGINTLV